MPLLASVLASVGLAHAMRQNNSAPVRIFDSKHDIELTLDTDRKCVLSKVVVCGEEVGTAASGFKVGGKWITTSTLATFPKVETKGSSVKVTGIEYGQGDVQVDESWSFEALPDGIAWTISRTYKSSGTVEDSASPLWSFKDMSTWTGALLDTGGVAWCKLFDQPNATYGVQSNSAVLWNSENDSCLAVESKPLLEDRSTKWAPSSLRFTREPSGTFTMAAHSTRQELLPKHDLARFLKNAQDVWLPLKVGPSDSFSTRFLLTAKSYNEAYGRGSFVGLDEHAVRDLLNTIGRIGVIDDKVIGTNGWYSGYAVLHEPWIALMGFAINDPAYTNNYARTLDFQRDHAVEKDGMVNSRWAYGAWDSQPGTYNKYGFYECQWGRLMDTQPSYAINIAEQFDLTGDEHWLESHLKDGEAALDYLLKRDTNGNGLVEMATDSRNQHKSSDWLDVVWASYESAYVNAQLYRALDLWADLEERFDSTKAERYRAFAKKLKASFNKPIDQGGFWDPKNKWYVYWRDKDGSIHGNNLVLPVNLMAIAYGVCDDPIRCRGILDRIEQEVSKENLFCWPVNIFSYQPDETSNKQFPTYENGDIFLAWAEVAIRAYAKYEPAIAVKYVRRILDRYRTDGLAFQRYLRADQSGAGDDILANNCSAVVGLYRDIFGIQPRQGGLYLDPHITPELSGTTVKYNFRGQKLSIQLTTDTTRVESGNCSVSCPFPFKVSFGADGIGFSPGLFGLPHVSVTSKAPSGFQMHVDHWSQSKMVWSVMTTQKEWVHFQFSGLIPADYRLTFNSASVKAQAREGELPPDLEMKPGIENRVVLEKIDRK